VRRAWLWCRGLGEGGRRGATAELAPVVIGAVQRDAAPLYRVTAERGDYRAEKPALGWAVRFGADWVEVKLKGESAAWGLRLRLIGFGAAEVKPVPVLRGRTVAGNRVSYDRGVLEEWYVNGPLGLEQGFTVKEPPMPGASALVLRLDVGEGWRAAAEGSEVKLMGSQKMLYYGALHTVDAKGQVLPGRLVVGDGKVLLRISLNGAVYPVTIDPLLSESAKLTASDATRGAFFGNSVALSAMGRTALGGHSGLTAPLKRCARRPTYSSARMTGCGLSSRSSPRAMRRRATSSVSR
jgi:FG-GAP repeat